MAKKAKKAQDLDIKITKAWLDFNNALESELNNSDTYVDLGFESSIDSKTHFSFEVEEIIYYTGTQITPAGFVSFKVPYGTKEKAFVYKDAELVTVKTDSYKQSFQQLVDNLFTESFKEIPDIPTIRRLETDYLAKEKDLVEVLNDADYYLSEIEKKKERANKYDNVEMFGIF